MRTTRTVLLASLLVALMYAAGQALSGIPNVELVTALAFLSGYLLGPALGALVGAAGMGAHSLFNVMGAVAPPIWIAQMAAYAIVGAAGGVVGPILARSRRRVRAALFAGITGALLVLLYQIVVNAAAFYAFASDVDVWVYVWGGIAFGAIQVAWNVAFFAAAIPPTLRVLAHHRTELRPARTDREPREGKP